MNLGVRVTRALRRALTENLGLKLIAIVASITLFSLVRGAEDGQRSFFVDVAAVMPPPSSGKILVSEVPDQIKVTVRAPRSLLNSLGRDDIDPVHLDLRDTRKRYYYLDPALVDVPAGAHIVQLAPASIPLTWAERRSKWMRVEPHLVGSPKQGLVLDGPPTVDPSSVEVLGPAQEVESLAHVGTIPIDLSGLTEGKNEQRVPLERLPPHSQYGRHGPVRVSVSLTAAEIDRTFENLHVAVEGRGIGWPARPVRVTVSVRGPRAAVEALEATQIVAFVRPAPGSGPGPHPIAVRGLPENVSVTRTDPPDVLLGRH